MPDDVLLHDEPIFIAGPARSGSSFISSCFAQMGYFLGEPSHTLPYNERGFWNNDKLLCYFGTKIAGFGYRPNTLLPNCPHFTVPIKHVITVAVEYENILTVLKADGYTGGPWMQKDHRLTTLFEYMTSIFPKAKWIITLRNKEDIIKSCMNAWHEGRESPYLGAGVDYWEFRYNHFLEHYRRLKEKSVWAREIWPEKIIKGQDWSELEAVAGELGLQVTDKVKSMLDTSQWHYSSQDGHSTIKTKSTQ